jgi:hypothetical protein
LQQPPAGHGIGCVIPNVAQHGCPGAPQATHWLAWQRVFAAVHADPGAAHLFVAGSQHAVEAHGGPVVQHAMPS